jgi:CHAT domain-containing protein/Tfp pilus assembly protein PilF
LRLWLLFHAADTLAQAHESEGIDDAYLKIIQLAAGDGSEIKTILLRAWADTLQQRADWSNAEKHYVEAEEESKKLGVERLILADTLDHLGLLVLEAGDLDKSESYYSQALGIKQRLAPGSLSLARSLNGLANTAQDRGDLDKAVAYHRDALAIRQKQAPGSLDVARSLGNLGNIALNQGDLAKAEEYYHQTLAIQEKVAPGSLGVAMTLSNLGLVTDHRGEPAKAQEYADQAYAIRNKVAPYSLDVALSLTNLGMLADERGDLAKAEKYYRQALSIDTKISPENIYVAVTLGNLGNVAYHRGDWARAEEYQRQALKIRQKLSPETMQLATVLLNLGAALWFRGHRDQAQQYLHQALAIEQKINPGSLDVAESLDDLGDMAMEQSDLSKAEDYCLQAFAIRKKLAPGGPTFADSLMSLGELARKRNDLAKAEDFYRQALVIREKLSSGSSDHAESLAALAGILKSQHKLGDASRLYEQALDVLENQVARLGGSEQVRSAFRAQHADYYKDYIDLLVSQKQTEHAFEILERFRARSLLEILALARVDISQGVDPALMAQERSLQELIDAKSNRRIELLNDKDAAEQVAAFDGEIKALLDQYHDVEAQFRAASPTYAALTQPRPLTAKEVQQRLLDDATILLEYSLGEERSYVFAVTPSSLTMYEMPKRTEIEAAATQLHKLLKSGGGFGARGKTAGQSDARLNQVAAALSRMVLAPVADQIKAKRLLIVSDGALQYIPFAMLPVLADSNGPARHVEPLMVGHEIVNLPSASVLAVLRSQGLGRKQAAHAVAVLADPVFGPDDDRVTAQAATGQDGTLTTVGLRNSDLKDENDKDAKDKHRDEKEWSEEHLSRSAADVGLMANGVPLSRLPFTRREAEAIFAVTPSGEAMKALDFKASRETATSPELSKYRMVHFATHGLLDSEHPELSGLVLSLVNEQGKRQNGFLELQDIYNLNLPAELVVLSACETGLGKQIQGEGLIGLTRGFMYAGASRVVASLWKVDDIATAELMGRFYKGMEKDHVSPAAALRRAQIEMWKQPRWRDPYYWAAFELQGEWK